MSVDFDALVNSAAISTFGEQAANGAKARYTPQDSSAFDLDGIYDEAWREIEIHTSRHSLSLPVSTTKPAFSCRLADFPGGVKPLQGDTLVLRGNDYTVADVQPDGISGWVRLILN